MEKRKKKRYNLTYRLRCKGYEIDTKRRKVVIPFTEERLTKMLTNDQVRTLINEFNYALEKSRQLRLFE